MPKPSSPQRHLLQRLGTRIQRFRLNGNMTQEALAGMINSNATYVSKIENGNAVGLTIVKLEEISLALNVTLSDLFAPDSGNAKIEEKYRYLAVKAQAVSESDQKLMTALHETIVNHYSSQGKK